MAHIIAVANQKGGCGKTTVSMNLAGAMGRVGYKVLVLDADPQASAMKWRMNSEDSGLPFEIRPYPYPTLHKEIRKWADADSFDVILIDCPPGGSRKEGKTDNITRSAILAAHLVIIPVRPSPLDYQASEDIMPLLDEISVSRPDVRIFIVINGKPPGRTRMGTEARAAALRMFSIEGLEIRVFQTELHTRQVYVEAPAAGQVVVDYDTGSKGSLEIQSLTEEVLECLSQSAVA